MSQSVPEFTSPAEEVVRLLPIYVVCDTSQSMGQDGAIDAVNEGLAGVIREIQRAGKKGDDIRVCVIRFSTNAKVELPLTAVDIETNVPPMKASGVTNLTAAIKLLASTISADYHALAARNERAYRPAVFLFTDGRPTDENGREMTDPTPWQGPLADLKLQPWEPRIYSYGFGNARREMLQQLVDEKGISDSVLETRVSFSGDDAAASIGRLFPALFKTLISAAEAAAAGASDEEVGRALDAAHAATSAPRKSIDAWFDAIAGR